MNRRFLQLADWVSYQMGSPTNIVAWLLVLAVWVALGPWMANHAFLPGWFTSNGFNFPLNTVTTVAELFIGFLVAAAANRVQRIQERQQAQHFALTSQIEAHVEHLEAMETRLMEAILNRTLPIEPSKYGR